MANRTSLGLDSAKFTDYEGSVNFYLSSISDSYRTLTERRPATPDAVRLALFSRCCLVDTVYWILFSGRYPFDTVQ